MSIIRRQTTGEYPVSSQSAFVPPLSAEPFIPLKTSLSFQPLLKALATPELPESDPKWLDRCKVDLELVTQALERNSDGSENDFQAIEEIESWLEKQLQKLQKKSASDAQPLIDTAQKISGQLQTLKQSFPEWIAIQKQVQPIVEKSEQLLEAWHEMRTSEFGHASQVVDTSLSCFNELALNIETLVSIYSRIKHFPTSHKTQLLLQIEELLKMFASEEDDFRHEMLSSLTSDLQNASAALSTAQRTEESLRFSLRKKAPLSQLFNAYRDLQNARAQLSFHQKKCKESENGQSIGTALARIVKTLAPLGNRNGSSQRLIPSHLEALLHPIQTLFPSAEQQLALDEERVFQSLASIHSSFQEDRNSLRTAVAQNASDPKDGDFFDRWIKLDPHGNGLALLLKRPFTEKAKLGGRFDRTNPKEYLEAQKQLALILSIESALPQTASAELKENVRLAKIMATKALGIDLPRDPILFYAEVLQAEEQLDMQERIAEWQKREIELLHEMQKPNDARIRNLWLFLFLPLQMGSWAYSCQQMVDQGAFIHKQGMLHRWQKEFAERGYTEKLPPEWQTNPEYTKAWLSDLHRQMLNMSDEQFQEKLLQMPRDSNLRQMLTNWWTEARNDPKPNPPQVALGPKLSQRHIHQSFLALPAEEEMSPLENYQTSAASTNEFFLFSWATTVIGWFSPNTPSPNEQNLAHALNRYQTQVKKLEKDIQNHGWHQYRNQIQRAIQVGNDLETRIASLRSMSEIEREHAILITISSLDKATLSLQPLCNEIQAKDPVSLPIGVPIEVDLPTFQHFVLSRSQVVRNTGLVGGDPIKMLEHFSSLVDWKLSIVCNPRCDSAQKRQFRETLFGPLDLTNERECQLFQSFQPQIKTAIEIGKAFKSGDYGKFSSAIQKALEDLKEGKSFFFSGGWTKIGASRGHAVVYEIIKQKTNGYTFRIYNRGEGSEDLYHHEVIKGKMLLLPFIEVVDVQKDKLNNPVFIKMLQEPNKPPAHGKDWDADELTLTFLKFLEGRESSNHYPSNQMMEELILGHCSFLSLDALFKQHLGPSRHERWLIESSFITLWVFSRGDRAQIEKNIAFLKMGHTQVAIDVERGFNNGIVSSEELPFFQRELTSIGRRIRRMEEVIASRVIAAATRGPLVASSNVPWSVTLPESSMEIVESNRAQRQPYHPLTVQNWNFSPATFNLDLQHLLVNISHAKENNQPLLIKEVIREFVAKIPLDCTQKTIEQSLADLWSPISPKDAEVIMKNLALLGQEFFDAIQKLEKIDEVRCCFKVAPRDILVQTKIFTLADSLSRQFKDSFGLELPNLIEEALWTFLDGSRPYNDLRDDPAAALDRASLEIYWKKMSPHNYKTSFFRLEASETATLGCIEDSVATLADLPPNSDVAFASQWLLSHPKEKQTIQANLKSSLVKPPPLIEGYVALGSTFAILQKGRKIDLANPDANNKVLPFPFYISRNLAFLIHVSMHERVSPLAPRIIIQIDPDATRVFSTNFPHLTTAIVYRDGYKPQQNTEANVQIIPEHLNPFVNDLIRHRREPYDVVSSHHRRRIAPHERLLQPTSPHFSRAISQELLALSSVAELQVRSTLSFFEQNKMLLQRRDFQLLFETLLLEKNFLFEEFTNHPEEAEHLAKQIATFFKGQIDFYEKTHDTLTVTFFLRLNVRVAHIWHYATTKTHSSSLSPFENSWDHWKRLIDSSRTQKELAILLAESAISLAHHNSFTNEEASRLILAHLFFNLFGPTAEDSWWSNEQEEARRDLPVKKRDPLSACLADPDRRDPILNWVAGFLMQQNVSEKWIGDYPFFTTESQNLSIDLLNGKFSIKEAPFRTLPLEIRENSLFQKFFGLSPSAAAEIHPGLWQFRFQECLYRIKKPNLGNMELFRSVGSEWQRYYSPDELSALPFRSLVEKSNSWGSKTKIYFEDARTKALIAEGDLQNSNVLEIHQIVDGRDTGLILRNIYSSDPDYQFLHAIENSRWITVWQKQGSNEPETLELPRYHLTFKAQKSKNGWEYFSKEYPGYRIATVQASYAIPGVSCFFVLENDLTKEKRYLVPELPITKSSKLDTNLAFNIPDNNTVIKVTELQEDRSGALKTTTTAGKLKLAEIYLLARNYPQAMHFLTGGDPHDQYSFRSGEQLVPFNETELNIIYHILENDDMAPNAVAVRIKAQLILLQNGQEDQLPRNKLTGEEREKEIEKRTRDYVAFLQHREQGQNPFSSEKEERFFIERTLDLRDPLIESRYRKLCNHHQSEPTEVAMNPFPSVKADFDFDLLKSCPPSRSSGEPSIEPSGRSLLRAYIVHPESFNYFLNLIQRSSFVEVYCLFGFEPEPNWSKEDYKKQIDQILQLLSSSKDKNLANHALCLLTELRDPPFDSHQLGKPFRVHNSLNGTVAKPPSESPYTFRSTEIVPAPSGVVGNANSSPRFDQNMWARVSPFGQKTIINHSEKFFTITEQNQDEPQRTMLHRLFSRNVTDQLLIDDIAFFLQNSPVKSQESSRVTLSVRPENLKDLSALRKELADEIGPRKESLKRLEALIVALANQAPKDKTAASFREITFISGSNHPLSLQELLHLTAANDMAIFHQRNPFLSEEEIWTLFSLIIEYQSGTSELQLINQIIEAIDAYIKAKEDGVSPSEEASLAEKLKSKMDRRWVYDVRKHPEYLNREIAERCLLRSDQVEKLGLFSSDQSIAIEAPPGFGKTSVMLPELAF